MKKNNFWKFYLNSNEAWDAMLKAIEDASLSIDLEQYIFENDGIGKKFINLLKRKAGQGLKVRVICDEVGSFSFSGSEEAKELERSGVNLKFFNPLLPWKPNKETLWYFRDHRKLLIIDGTLGFTGSVCLSDEMQSWRESHVEISGSVVTEMQEAFNVMWNRQYRRLRYILKRNKKTEVNTLSDFSYVTNSPLPRKRFMYYELIKRIRMSRKYIYLTTPYFLPNHRLLSEIKKAAQRGVVVKLLLPKTTNHILAHIGAQTFFTDLLIHNVEIHRYEQMIHSKTIVIDGTWSTIGSLNLDNISLIYNFEANLISTNDSFTMELEKQFINDLQISSRLTRAEWKRRPFGNKILEFIIWPFRKFI